MPPREILDRSVIEALHKAQPGLFNGEGPKVAETIEAWIESMEMSTSMWLDLMRGASLPLAVSRSSAMLEIVGRTIARPSTWIQTNKPGEP